MSNQASPAGTPGTIDGRLALNDVPAVLEAKAIELEAAFGAQAKGAGKAVTRSMLSGQPPPASTQSGSSARDIQ